MRILLILLGLSITISSMALLGVMLGLVLTNWPLLDTEKVLFLIDIAAVAAFVIILTTIPHGKIGGFNKEHREK
jgi:hypothetical protein